MTKRFCQKDEYLKKLKNFLFVCIEKINYELFYKNIFH